MDNGRGRPIVLIVDDQPENVEFLVQTLDDLYDLRVALNGFEALRVAESDPPPDLILLDILMPGMDGYEACKKLKAGARTRNIPILFVTALNEIEDEAKGLKLGAIDYITKPISPPIVRARVKNHLELKRRRDLLEDLSSIDGLTIIANRRRFDDVLDKEWRRSSRSESSIALMLADIDFFKAYNDHYGHVAGDECLKLVAQTLQACFSRASDLVARYGGEEFAAILGGMDEQGAVVAAERAMHEIRSLDIEHARSSVADRVTISAGVASTTPSPGSSPDVLVDAADKMLYLAKKEGRDRIKSCVVQTDRVDDA